MDPASMIVTALVQAIVVEIVSGVASDAYFLLRAAILRKLGEQSEPYIEKIEQNPNYQPYQDELAEHLREADVEDDIELQQLANDLVQTIETLTPVDRMERAQRKGGLRAVDRILQRHISGVLDARSPIDDVAHGCADRHVDALVVGNAPHSGRGINAFRHRQLAGERVS